MPAFPPTFVTNFFIPNPDLKPEQSKSWELGLGIDFQDVLAAGDHLIAKASYYRSDVTDLIDLEVSIPAGCFGAPFPPCGSGQPFGNFSRNVNVTDARIEGVELQLNYHAPRFYVRANYSTIDGRNTETGAFVGLLTPDRFYIDAGLNWYENDIRIGGRLTVAGSFEAVNDPVERRDSYVTGDLYLVWQPATGPLEGLRVDLGIDNITDTDYDVVAAGATQPGRNFKISLGWREGF